MSSFRIHVLYEHGVDKRPFGSASIRLIRPLTHPSLQSKIQVSFGLTYEGQPVDAVIVDRLWRPDISPRLAQELLEKIRLSGARLIYALDDSFLDLPDEKKDWDPTAERLHVVKYFQAQADGVLVTTPALKSKFSPFNSRIAVVPHALDERLLPGWRFPTGDRHPSLNERLARYADRLIRCPATTLRMTRPRRIVIGYMGTLTHDDDLMMILPALQAVCRRYRGKIEVQMIGVIGRSATRPALQELPLRRFRLTPKKVEYTRFLAWFSRCIDWDIAIAPLKDSPFNNCKSDIKFLDYCAIGAAGIYSRVPAYQDTVRHQQTGWLVENTTAAWTQALEELLADAGLRNRLAENAIHYLFAKRVMARSAQSWVNAFETLLKPQ